MQPHKKRFATLEQLDLSRSKPTGPKWESLPRGIKKQVTILLAQLIVENILNRPIDDDLGQSASGLITRNGFERLVADVCMGKVGAVAARELSRFARNSREWQQLIEVCRVVDTVLIDHEQVYSPRVRS